jgi:hypothetical protein
MAALACVLVVRILLSAVAPLRPSDQEREAELLVLRHQVKVLSRRARRPLFRRCDRIPFAAYETASSREAGGR